MRAIATLIEALKVRKKDKNRVPYRISQALCSVCAHAPAVTYEKIAFQEYNSESTILRYEKKEILPNSSSYLLECGGCKTIVELLTSPIDKDTSTCLCKAIFFTASSELAASTLASCDASKVLIDIVTTSKNDSDKSLTLAASEALLRLPIPLVHQDLICDLLETFRTERNLVTCGLNSLNKLPLNHHLRGPSENPQRPQTWNLVTQVLDIWKHDREIVLIGLSLISRFYQEVRKKENKPCLLLVVEMLKVWKKIKRLVK